MWRRPIINGEYSMLLLLKGLYTQQPTRRSRPQGWYPPPPVASATPRPPRPRRSISDNKKALADLVDSATEIHLNIISCKNITVEMRDPATGKEYGFLPGKDLMEWIGQGHHTIKPLKPVNYVKIPLLRVWDVEEHPMEQKRGSRDLSMPLIRSYYLCEALQKMQVVVDDDAPFPGSPR